MTDKPTQAPFDADAVALHLVLYYDLGKGIVLDAITRRLQNALKAGAEQMRERAVEAMRESAVCAKRRAAEYVASGRRDHADCCEAYADAYEVGAGAIGFLPLTPETTPKEEGDNA